MCAADEAQILKPAALKRGDTVMLVTPARGVNQAKIEWSRKRLEGLGLRVKLHPNTLERNGYLAGTDEQRAAQINDAFSDPEVAGVLPVTGGFGTTRIVDKLDYELIRKNPKVLVGFSDITGLHLAIQKKVGLVTFHGPNVDSGFGVPQDLQPVFEVLVDEGFDAERRHVLGVSDWYEWSQPDA